MYFYRSVIGIMAPKRPGTPTGGSEKKRKNNVLTISEKIDLLKKLDGFHIFIYIYKHKLILF